MIEKGLSLDIMRRKLNRTRKSVYFKIKRLGLKVPTSVDNDNQKFSTKLSPSIEAKELMTHEQVLKVLSVALQRLQESDLDQEEVKRLKTLSIFASRYDALLERYERWDEIERRLKHIEARLEEMASTRESRETPISG